MTHKFTAILAVIAPLVSPSFANEIISGRVTIIDVDTIEVAGEKLRFAGIDGPENGQLCYKGERPFLCGSVAALWLDDLIGGDHITCQTNGIDRFKRKLATCQFKGEDIAAKIILEGYGFDFVKHSRKEYASEESEARKNKRGLWAYRFVYPWDYRKCKRAGGSRAYCSGE